MRKCIGILFVLFVAVFPALAQEQVKMEYDLLGRLETSRRTSEWVYGYPAN